MNRNLKVAGIIVISIIVLTILISVFLSASRNMLSSNSDFGGDDSFSAPAATGLSGRSIGVSNSVKSEKLAVNTMETQAISTPIVVDKKIIKNGNLSLKVERVDSAVEKITQISKDNQGEIFSSNFSQTKANIKSGSMIVKVPVANFEKTFGEIKSVASLVMTESTSGQDVTEEYTDMQGQLKNKQAEEQQFVDIMKQAQKIQDILDVTQQLSRVRGEIERLQGRIKLMDSQTNMSTISVYLSEDQNITVVDSWRPWQVIKDSVNILIKDVQGSINFIIKLVINIIPILIIWVIIFWVIYLIGKKIYLKFKK